MATVDTKAMTVDERKAFFAALDVVCASMRGNSGSMTDKDARAFERKPIAFGKDQGKPIGSVDPDYLLWVADSSAVIRMYVQSERFQARLQRDGEQ